MIGISDMLDSENELQVPVSIFLNFYAAVIFIKSFINCNL